MRQTYTFAKQNNIYFFWFIKQKYINPFSDDTVYQSRENINPHISPLYAQFTCGNMSREINASNISWETLAGTKHISPC